MLLTPEIDIPQPVREYGIGGSIGLLILGFIIILVVMSGGGDD